MKEQGHTQKLGVTLSTAGISLITVRYTQHGTPTQSPWLAQGRPSELSLGLHQTEKNEKTKPHGAKGFLSTVKGNKGQIQGIHLLPLSRFAQQLTHSLPNCSSEQHHSL